MVPLACDKTKDHGIRMSLDDAAAGTPCAREHCRSWARMSHQPSPGHGLQEFQPRGSQAARCGTTWSIAAPSLTKDGGGPVRFTARSKSSKRTHPNNQITEWRSSATMKNRGTPRPRPICHPSPASTRPSRVFARSVLRQIEWAQRRNPAHYGPASTRSIATPPSSTHGPTNLRRSPDMIRIRGQSPAGRLRWLASVRAEGVVIVRVDNFLTNARRARPAFWLRPRERLVVRPCCGY